MQKGLGKPARGGRLLFFSGIPTYSKAESSTPLKGMLGVATCDSVICFWVWQYTVKQEQYSFKGNVRPSVLALSAFLSA